MFISRKKYEEALEQARKEGAEKAWEQQHNASMATELHHRIDMICDRLDRMENKNPATECRTVNIVPPERPFPCFCGVE